MVKLRDDKAPPHHPHHRQNHHHQFGGGGGGGGFGRGRGRGWWGGGRGGFGGRGGGACNFGGGCGNGSWRKNSLCSATFVREVNLPSRTEVAPSQTLIKTWELTNSGPVAWEGAKLIYHRGSLPSLENEFDVRSTAPGQTTAVNAVVRTPAVPGRYRAAFRMQDADGARFGPRMWCDLVVVPGAAASDAALAPSTEAAVAAPAAAPAVAVAEAAVEAKAAELVETRQVRPAVDALANPAEPAPSAAPNAAPVKTAKDDGKGGEEDDVVVVDPVNADPNPSKYAVQMAALAAMGWGNDELNLFLLDQNDGNVQRVCNWLLEQMKD